VVSAMVSVEQMEVDVIGWVFLSRTVKKNGTWYGLVTAGGCSPFGGRCSGGFCCC
jgi:hypothetical protein